MYNSGIVVLKMYLPSLNAVVRVGYCSCVSEDLVAVFDDELHGIVFRVHVGHFAL